MRSLVAFVLAGLSSLPAGAATLQRLSLDEMAVQSTEIVRGRVQRSGAGLHGSMVYTHYSVFVSDRWKGTGGRVVDVALQGGEAAGIKQSFDGVPELADGQEYVLFLWRSRSGLNLIMGLSQGLFAVTGSSAKAVALQTAPGERMVGAPGASGEPVRMSVAEMRKRVQVAAARAAR